MGDAEILNKKNILVTFEEKPCAQGSVLRYAGACLGVRALKEESK